MGSYRERPVHPGLVSRVEAVWIVEQPAAPGTERRRVMPDGCVDLVRRPGGGTEVAGPSTTAFDVDLPPGQRHFGVRFRPGAAEAVLGVRADALRDGRAALDELWAAAAVRRLDVAGELVDEDDDIEAALDRFQRELVRLLADRPPTDPVVEEAVERIHDGDGRVTGLGRELGISDRQLRRRFDRAIGYGPKHLARVFRFQRAWAMGLDAAGRGDPSIGWASIAAMTGYADQPHLVNDFTALAGDTPTRLVRSRVTNVRFLQSSDDGALISSSA